MYFIEAEINKEMKKITKPDGEVLKLNTSVEAWDLLYNIFNIETVHIEGTLTKVSEIKSLSVGYDKS